MQVLLRPPDWICTLYLNICLLKDWYVRFQLVLESNASWTLWIYQRTLQFIVKRDLCQWGVMDPDYQGEIWVILQNEGKDALFINKHDQIAQLLILPCVIGKVQKGEPLTLLTFWSERVSGSINEITAIGTKVWVKQPNSTPIAADVTVHGKDNIISVMIPRQEKCSINPLLFSWIDYSWRPDCNRYRDLHLHLSGDAAIKKKRHRRPL